MTTIDELKRIAGRERVGLGIIEKDHTITVALLVISKTKLSNMIVFKGGTAIKKMFYPKARFSEDLDFNCERDIAEELEKEVERPLVENDEGVDFTGVRQDESRSPEGRRLRLEYNDSNRYHTSIKIDLAFREKTVMRASLMKVRNPYHIRNPAIRTMNIREIAAEKVRALIATGRPRHLYDVWFLLRRGISPDRMLVDTKLKLYGETLTLSRLRSAAEDAELNWQTDLQALLPMVPNFANVERYVVNNFRHSHF